ncbi:MAG TPA: peptidoglycan DD-metalloendopeptidase family protein, partial [Thiolinea sp.]|nr:peptidoglycan DD-metalloendopeptidase family protein [Thiolinea sp.]
TTKISAINAAVDKVQALTNDMEKDRLALTSAEQALTIQKKSLQDVVASREDKLKNITSDIRLKRTQVERLREQAAKLQTKFDELAANSPSKEAEPAEPEPIDTQPEKLPAATASSAEVAQRLEKPTTQEEVTSQFSSNKPFSTLKKQLSVPVSGQIIHTFNSEMNEKQKWQGIVIAAANGSKVRAVAPGKVAYTGQMDGYGFLTIIEHDHNYMTLYAYNRANYKKVGDSVNAGDVIAAVGNSGGQEQDALYFEIRKRGAVQNPAQWLR